jgi:tagatose 1,6-diphosphate aldolase GatY/KbaY
MLTSTHNLLRGAQIGGYAIGAFNIYNLEGVKAVIAAAEGERSPVMLQLHPGAMTHGGSALIALCLEAARGASVPAAVHLDHSDSAAAIQHALTAGIKSVMADGSHLDYEGNVTFTREMAAMARQHQAAIEAELGRLSGTEDGLTVAERDARMTDPSQAADFVAQTGIDALAVCIGNIHGRYPGEPRLDFERLAAIRAAVDVPLVLHGASGLPEKMIHQSIALGVCKFNVNTEVREAYLDAIRQRLDSSPAPDLVDLMAAAENAMMAVVASKIRLFGSSGRA